MNKCNVNVQYAFRTQPYCETLKHMLVSISMLNKPHRAVSRVPGPLDEVRQMVDEVESVERVASDLCNRPHH